MKGTAVLAVAALWLLGAACSREPDPEELVEVVVAGADLAAGTTLDVSLLARRFVPQKFASPNVIRAAQPGEAVSRMTLSALSAGDPVLRSSLGPATGEAVFAAHVEVTWRGYWLDVSTPVSLSEILRRGDRVDVADGHAGSVSGEARAVTTAQDVVVLDVRPQAVALQVSPQDAARLTLATDLGSLRLSVRSPKDRQSLPSGPTAGIRSLLPTAGPGEKQRLSSSGAGAVQARTSGCGVVTGVGPESAAFTSGARFPDRRGGSSRRPPPAGRARTSSTRRSAVRRFTKRRSASTPAAGRVHSSQQGHVAEGDRGEEPPKSGPSQRARERVGQRGRA
jgi:pilus assembly protein CpaB